jgi:transcriptional regulator with XRE-family HTH domain
MRDEILDKSYREAFVEENMKAGIAFQMSALRDKRGWTQAELGERAGKPQNVISRIENPDYGRFTLRTLLDIAAAFDVALLVKFVSYGDLLAQLKNVSPEILAVPSFEEERRVPTPSQSTIDRLSAPAFRNKSLHSVPGMHTRDETGALGALLSAKPNRSERPKLYEARNH